MPINVKPPFGRGYRIRFTPPPPPPPATPPAPMRSILKVNLAAKNNGGGCDEESNSSNGTVPTCASSREGLLVHFGKSRDDDDAQLTVDIAVIPNRKDLDRDQLYYNRYEIKKMRTEAHARAATFLPSKKRLLQETYESCLPFGKTTNTTASTTTAFQAHKALACLYQQSDRGLERFILSELPEKRQDTVQRIVRLQHQDSLADHDEHLIRLLRMRSLLLSRKALQFALCLGAADAWEVEQHR